MISFRKFELPNGLKAVVHEDHSVPLAAVNILYNVGSRDENPDKTGFAHLFEHLMFGGSVNIPKYDEPLQKVGGENNAFTTPDITNYYIQIPAINIETAFWLESDRMLGLDLNTKTVDIQKKVVIEEFKQRYLNQPYGDVWLKIRPLAYERHPYRWPTIGKDIKHIEDATLEDVKSFYRNYYHPGNAILSVAGDITFDQVRDYTEKWFGEIEHKEKTINRPEPEAPQVSARYSDVYADVPLHAIYKVYHMPGRLDPGFHASDFLSDILGRGKSSRLFLNLVKKRKLFNTVDSFITGSIDPGLLVISGKINDHYSLEEADVAINELLDDLVHSGPSVREIEKIRNQNESAFALNELEILNKAMNLAYFYNLGDPGIYNEEWNKIRETSQEDIMTMSREIFRKENCSTLFYHAGNNRKR